MRGRPGREADAARTGWGNAGGLPPRPVRRRRALRLDQLAGRTGWRPTTRSLVPQLGPGRAPGRLDKLDQHAVATLGVDKRDRALSAFARGDVDKGQAHCGQAVERRLDVRHFEADVVEPLTLGFEEARGTGRVVSRLDKFDLGVTDWQEADRDVVVCHVHDGLQRAPELVAIEVKSGVEVTNDDRDVVDL